MIPTNTSIQQEYLLPPLPSTERGKRTVIDVDPKNNNRIAYAHGKCVYLVDLQDPSKNEAYTEHSHTCTVARFSPTGFYIASADLTGKVRIWDATQPSHILKAEYQVLSGPIRDLSWDVESRHIIAVGEGREKFAHAFLFDSGSSCGEVIGHNKAINSVSIRLCRPLRAATASDDFTVNFYSGTPYKFSKSLKNHSRFVQCVQFSPDGSKFATCGSDGKIFMYDGENGDLIKEFVDKELKSSAHASGVLALCWSPDSSKLASSSMDHSTKIWNVETGNISIQNKISFTQKTIQDNQLVSNAWTGMGVLVLSLSGAYAIFDPVSGEQKLLFEGHQKGISCLGLNIQGSIVSASYDGAICLWNDYFQASLLTKTGQNIPENQIDSIIAGQDGEVLAASHLSFTGFAISSDISCEKREWLGRLSLARVNENIVALAENGIEVLSNVGEKLAEFTNFKSKPLTLAAHESMIAVGLQDKTICLFEYADFKLNYLKDHELSANFGAISALAFSPEGTKLAAGDDQRRLKIYDTKTFEVCKNNWCYHNAKISSVAWLSEDLVVSGSLDNSIMMWTPSSPIKPVATISNAHTGPIVSLLGLEAGRFVSASQDGSMKIWKLVKSE